MKTQAGLLFFFTLVLRMYPQGCTPPLTMPNTVLTDPLPYQATVPGSGIKDTVCIGTPFETVINLRTPGFLTVSGATLTVTAVSIPVLNGISGLPAAFSYSCNPPNCNFPAQTIGCIVIYGTANPGSEGTYDISLQSTISTAIGSFPVNLPEPTLLPGNFFLTVRAQANQPCVASGITKLEDTQWSISPNPTTGLLQLGALPPDQVVLMDYMGKVLMFVENPGPYLDISAFPTGVYFLIADDHESRYWGRVVKE